VSKKRQKAAKKLIAIAAEKRAEKREKKAAKAVATPAVTESPASSESE